MCECVPANERGRRSFQTTFSANLVTLVTPGARTRRAAGLVTGHCGCETHRLLMLARGTFSHFPRCDKSAVPFAGTAGICNTPSRSLNKYCPLRERGDRSRNTIAGCGSSAARRELTCDLSLAGYASGGLGFSAASQARSMAARTSVKRVYHSVTGGRHGSRHGTPQRLTRAGRGDVGPLSLLSSHTRRRPPASCCDV